MAKSQTTKRDEEHEVTRRALIKWSLAAGAALGVSKSGIYEILEKTAGKGVAFAASEHPANRLFAIVCGTGGGAWFQLLWPHVDVAMASNPNSAWHKPGMARLAQGTRYPLAIGPDTPWQNLPPQRQVTAMMAGSNLTHQNNNDPNRGLGGSDIYAIAGALQSQISSVVPMITLGDLSYGTAPGAPNNTQVAQATGMVDLFNSVASRAGGLLSQSRDATLYRAHYEAFAQLNRAANRSTTKSAYVTAANAAALMGTNLASKLAITQDDLNRYGITGNTRGNVAALGRAMIIGVKAFKLGLTNTIMVPGPRDDPHGAFAGGDVNVVPAQLKLVMDAFMKDLDDNMDDQTGQQLSASTVITVQTDTFKSPNDRNGWPDGTPGGSNWLYIYGAGNLFSGWRGGIDRNNNVRGYDQNGNDAPYNAAQTTRLALASVAYAIAKKDERAITQFANGLKIGGVFGPNDIT